MSKSIPPLTGIRGAAAALVVLLHLPVIGQLPLIRNGFYGVDLFFLLSGFILFHIHGDELRTWSATKRFFLLRFLRVYPLHLAVLFAIVAQVALFPGYAEWVKATVFPNAFTVAGFVQTLTLTNRVGLPELGVWNFPSWSLSSEALAYILFPLLTVVCRTQVRKSPLLLFAGASLSIHAVAMFTGHQGVTRVLLTFPAGMALAQAAHLSPPRLAGLLTLASAAIALLALSFDALAPLSVFGFAGLVYGLSANTGSVSRALSSRPFMFLGTISFSLYLTHGALLLFLSWATGDALPPVAMGVTAALFGWVTYLAVEAPSHRLGRIVAKRAGSRPALVAFSIAPDIVDARAT